MNTAEFVEHSALAAGTVLADIESLCKSATDNHLTAVCVPPLYVKNARTILAQTNIRTVTVVGFPLGYSAIEAKVAELVLAIIDGADEVEMVINTSAVKNGDWQYLANELNTVMPIIRGKGRKLTVILETSLFTGKEIIAACDLYGAAGVDFIKIGTGFYENETVLEHLVLVRRHLADPVQLKIWVKNKNPEILRTFIEAGANRLCYDYRL